MHGRYVHACIGEQAVDGEAIPSFLRACSSFSSLRLASFSERKFVHEKSGKLDGAIASTVADERSSNERSTGIP